MSNVTIYQFELYDITIDGNRRSRRWATRQAIERLRGNVLEGTGTEVDASAVDTDILGMTARDFNPNWRCADF